jgi:hypothetical protein
VPDLRHQKASGDDATTACFVIWSLAPEGVVFASSTIVNSVENDPVVCEI